MNSVRIITFRKRIKCACSCAADQAAMCAYVVYIDVLLLFITRWCVFGIEGKWSNHNATALAIMKFCSEARKTTVLVLSLVVLVVEIFVEYDVINVIVRVLCENAFHCLFLWATINTQIYLRLTKLLFGMRAMKVYVHTSDRLSDRTIYGLRTRSANDVKFNSIHNISTNLFIILVASFQFRSTTTYYNYTTQKKISKQIRIFK